MKRGSRAFTVSLCLVGALGLSPLSAKGEGFISIYGGFAVTEDETFQFERTDLATGTTVSGRRSVDFDSSSAFGGRIGYWGDQLDSVGVALDVSTFDANDDEVDIRFYTVSPLLMLRAPLLRSDRFPRGRLHPYVAAGPALFLHKDEVDFGVSIDDQFFDPGFDLRLGLNWDLNHYLSVFGEYRYTHLELEINADGCVTSTCGAVLVRSGLEASANLTTHHGLVGLTLRF